MNKNTKNKISLCRKDNCLLYCVAASSSILKSNQRNTTVSSSLLILNRTIPIPIPIQIHSD